MDDGHVVIDGEGQGDDWQDIEQAAIRMATRIRSLHRAVRSLAALTAEIATLRDALAELPLRGIDAASMPAERRHAGGVAGPTSGHSLSSQRGGVQEGQDDRGEVIERRPISVTVSTQNGPVDLVRAYRALQSLPGVLDLNLASYTYGRAVFHITSDRPTTALPLSRAFLIAFPEGIVGDWVSEDKYAAVLSGPTAMENSRQLDCDG